MGTQILLMRHGESHSNVSKIFACRALDYDLTDKGKADVKAAIPSVEQFQPDCIFSSPSQRAIQTAEIIGAALGIPVVRDDRLLEADVGRLEGKDEYAEPYRSRFDEVLASWQTGNYDRAFPSGESFTDIDRRVSSFLNERILPVRSSRTMIVSHCLALMALVWKHGHRFQNKFTDNYIKTASTVVVTIPDGFDVSGAGKNDLRP